MLECTVDKVDKPPSDGFLFDNQCFLKVTSVLLGSLLTLWVELTLQIGRTVAFTLVLD